MVSGRFAQIDPAGLAGHLAGLAAVACPVERDGDGCNAGGGERVEYDGLVVRVRGGKVAAVALVGF